MNFPSLVLDRFAGSGFNRKPLGFRVSQLMRKPKVSHPSPSLSETTPEVSFGLVLYWLPPGGLEATVLGATKARVQLRRVLLGILLGRSPRWRQLQGRPRLCLLSGVS
jgi:hypothetical protein